MSESSNNTTSLSSKIGKSVGSLSSSGSSQEANAQSANQHGYGEPLPPTTMMMQHFFQQQQQQAWFMQQQQQQHQQQHRHFLNFPVGLNPFVHPSLMKLSWRKGKWIDEEEAFTKKLIDAFNSGYLEIPSGTTLRSFLSEKLYCDPMRITKKFAGSSCIGKQAYSPCDFTAVDKESLKAINKELDELEKTFREKIEFGSPLGGGDFYPPHGAFMSGMPGLPFPGYVPLPPSVPSMGAFYDAAMTDSYQAALAAHQLQQAAALHAAQAQSQGAHNYHLQQQALAAAMASGMHGFPGAPSMHFAHPASYGLSLSSNMSELNRNGSSIPASFYGTDGHSKHFPNASSCSSSDSQPDVGEKSSSRRKSSDMGDSRESKASNERLQQSAHPSSSGSAPTATTSKQSSVSKNGSTKLPVEKSKKQARNKVDGAARKESKSQGAQQRQKGAAERTHCSTDETSQGSVPKNVDGSKLLMNFYNTAKTKTSKEASNIQNIQCLRQQQQQTQQSAQRHGQSSTSGSDGATSMPSDPSDPSEGSNENYSTSERGYSASSLSDSDKSDDKSEDNMNETTATGDRDRSKAHHNAGDVSGGHQKDSHYCTLEALQYNDDRDRTTGPPSLAASRKRYIENHGLTEDAAANKKSNIMHTNKKAKTSTI